jgi:hypothetical protein
MIPPRAAPPCWTAELDPCRNEDSAGKCGGKHLHKDCPKRELSANAAAAAKKAVAGAQAYVAELHNDEDDPSSSSRSPLVILSLPRPPPSMWPRPRPARLPPSLSITSASRSAVLRIRHRPRCVLALVLFDSPPPSPPVSAGVFVVLSPALMPQPPATDLTAWICSAIAIGVAFFVLCVRRVSFFVRGLDCVAFFVVYNREPSGTTR